MPDRLGSTPSEAAVKGCRTRPKELLPLARSNVAIHSLRNLHAKIFVFDNAAIIGSTNVSSLSSNKLVEAAVLVTRNRKLIAGARRFVRDLAGDRVGEEELLRLDKLWNHKNLTAPSGGRKPAPPVRDTKREPIWVVPLQLEKWTPDLEKADRLARPIARKKMQNRLNDLSTFAWQGNEFGNYPSVGQQLIRIVTGTKTTMVEPPGRVTYIERLRKKAGEPRFIVYTEKPRRVNRKSLKRYVAQLNQHGREIKKIAHGRRPRLIKASSTIQSILHAWPIT